MKAVVQRVKNASVKIDNQLISRVGQGLLVFLGVKKDDTQKQADWLVEKILNLRIFGDKEDKMNLSVLETKGEILIISQFTLYGDCAKGRRPSFVEAAEPKKAEALYEYFISQIRKSGLKTQTGRFQAMMDVELTNAGPVTIILEI